MRRVILAALCLLTGTAVCRAEEPTANSPAPAAAAPSSGASDKKKLESHYFDSDGVKIHYVMDGEGEPVLLIHGFTANISQQWRAPGVFDALAKKYKVIAIDNRGHGRSDKPHDKEKYGLAMVEDQVRLLDHLGIDKAHIVGYSMGGFITDKLLSEHPERFITATLGGAGWMRENDERMAFIEDLATALETKGSIRPLIERLTPPDRPKPSEEQLKAVDQVFTLTNDTKALAAVARAMPAFAVSEEKIRGNKTPVLALIGGADPLKAGVDELVGVMPNLKVVEIPGADHIQAFADPLFASSLLEFLPEHAQTPAATK